MLPPPSKPRAHVRATVVSPFPCPVAVAYPAPWSSVTRHGSSLCNTRLATPAAVEMQGSSPKSSVKPYAWPSRRPRLRALGLLLGVAAVPLAAQAELPPSAYEEMQQAAPEAVVITIIDTNRQPIQWPLDATQRARHSSRCTTLSNTSTFPHAQRVTQMIQFLSSHCQHWAHHRSCHRSSTQCHIDLVGSR